MAANQIKAGIVLNYALIGINAISQLVYTPYMLRMLGQNDYGIYALAASIISYLTLLDFGFGSAVVRFTAKAKVEDNADKQASLFGLFTVIYAIIGAMAFIGGLVLYFNVDSMFSSTMTPDELDQTSKIIMLMVINVAVTFPLSIYGGIMQAHEEFIFLKSLAIIRVVLLTLTCFVVLYMGSKALGLVWVQTIYNIANLLIVAFVCRNRLHVRLKFSNFDKSVIKDILIFSSWVFIGQIMDKIYWNTGQFVLGAEVSTTSVAVYSVAVSLVGVFMSYSTAISSVFLPRLTAMVTSKCDPREISDIFIRTGRLQFIVIGLIFSGFVVFGNRFLYFWAGEDYGGTYICAVWLLGSLVIPMIQNVGISILQARNQLKFRSLSYLAIALVSLVGQILLARPFGPLGCSIATASALFLGQGLVMNIYYAAKQKIDILNFWRQILRMALAPVLLTIFCLHFGEFINSLNFRFFVAAVLVYTGVYILVLYICSLNKDERRLIKKPLYKLLCR